MSDTPQFSAIEEDINENPAKWLSQDITIDEGDGTTGQTIFAMIRGMGTITRVRAWLAVERALHQGGRDRVINKLEQKEAELQENGERPSWAEYRAIAEQTSIESTESVAVFVDKDGNEIEQRSSISTSAVVR